MRIDGRITSTTLEAEFWGYLAELAAERGIRLAPMFRIALAAVPAGTSRASRVRVFCLREARATARARELALGVAREIGG